LNYGTDICWLLIYKGKDEMEENGYGKIWPVKDGIVEQKF